MVPQFFAIGIDPFRPHPPPPLSSPQGRPAARTAGQAVLPRAPYGMAGRYAESSGKPSSAPQAAFEP